MATTSRGIVYPTTGNAVTPLATRFADLATSTDTAIGAVDTKFSNDSRQFYGPAASIGSVTGMKLGDTYQESNSNKILWKYDGANWVTNENGMFLIRPSSVSGTGISIASSGGVVGTSVSGTLDIMGIFSSRFDDYLIKLRYEKASNATETFASTFLVGSTPVSAALYFTQTLTSVAGSGPTLAYAGGQTSMGTLLDSSGMKIVSDVLVYSPNKAENTHVSVTSVGRGSSPSMTQRSTGLETNDQLTGIRFTNGQTLSNFRMKIYGMA